MNNTSPTPALPCIYLSEFIMNLQLISKYLILQAAYYVIHCFIWKFGAIGEYTVTYKQYLYQLHYFINILLI